MKIDFSRFSSIRSRIGTVLAPLRPLWERISPRLCWLTVPTFCFYELMFHLWSADGFSVPQILTSLGFAALLASVLNAAAVMLPSKWRRWWLGIWALLFAVLMMTEFMVKEAFQSFMTLERMITGAGGIAADFLEVVISMIGAYFLRIVLVLIPVAALFAAPAPKNLDRKRSLVILLIVCLSGSTAGFAGLSAQPGGLDSIRTHYDINTSLKNNGILVSVAAELFGFENSEGALEEDEFYVPPVTKAPEAEAPEAEIEIFPHTIEGLDFAQLAQDETNKALRSLNSYVASQTPASSNAYTGLFQGKNLILITAEAFSHRVIDPERTPTLYRLATQGIQFTDYYEPLWTGATSGGEMVNVSGLAMNCSMETYTDQLPFNNMGHMLQREGYFSRSYHNHDMYFYNRNKTHVNLGYEKFIARGNGMEKGVQKSWPESDEEMFRFTVPEYIGQQPFSIYYMTVSGHCRFTFQGNAMARKNRELVEDLPYSDVVKAYLACNMELEHSMAYLVQQLEEAGIADDTVIVIAPDHYPYGLEKGTTWNNKDDYLAELYGVDKVQPLDRDHSALIIWSGCLEGMNLQVDAPTCSVDILPTLSNLFGLEYDSRLSVGRDALGSEEAISIWPNYSWKTELGKYNAEKSQFIAAEDAQIPDGYVERINGIVKNKINFSRSVQRNNYFAYLRNLLPDSYLNKIIEN